MTICLFVTPDSEYSFDEEEKLVREKLKKEQTISSINVVVYTTNQLHLLRWRIQVNQYQKRSSFGGQHYSCELERQIYLENPVSKFRTTSG